MPEAHQIVSTHTFQSIISTTKMTDNNSSSDNSLFGNKFTDLQSKIELLLFQM